MGSRGWQFTTPAPQLHRSILHIIWFILDIWNLKWLLILGLLSFQTHLHLDFIWKSVHGALALTSSPLHRWNKLSRRLLTPESFKSTIWSFPSASRSDCVAYLCGHSASTVDLPFSGNRVSGRPVLGANSWRGLCYFLSTLAELLVFFPMPVWISQPMWLARSTHQLGIGKRWLNIFGRLTISTGEFVHQQYVYIGFVWNVFGDFLFPFCRNVLNGRSKHVVSPKEILQVCGLNSRIWMPRTKSSERRWTASIAWCRTGG